LNLPRAEGLNVSMNILNGTAFFNITDSNFKFENETYSFLFAGKY